MTFITPLIFGSSVMQDVATAGKETTNIIVENGMRVCEYSPEERMPMLLLIPYHVRGKCIYYYYYFNIVTYTMLGLGDVALPSVLLVYLLRFDHKNHTYFKGYFLISFIGYCFGLLFTFIAIVVGFEVNGVRGQPALLYIVPCILIPCLIVAHSRKQLNGLWNGSLLKFSSKTSECDMSPFVENEPIEPNDHTSLLSGHSV